MGVRDFYLIVIVIVALVIDYIRRKKIKKCLFVIPNLVYYALKRNRYNKVVTTWYVMIKELDLETTIPLFK